MTEKTLFQYEKVQALKDAPIHKVILDGDIDLRNITLPEYHNKETYVDRLPMLDEFLREHGHVIPFVLNDKGDGTFVIVYDPILFVSYTELGYREVLTYIVEVDDEQERKIYDQLNTSYGDIPKLYVLEYLKKIADNDDGVKHLEKARVEVRSRLGTKRNEKFLLFGRNDKVVLLRKKVEELQQFEGFKDKDDAVLKAVINQLTKLKKQQSHV